ncbi:MAG: N-acetyl-gamma-glutamyl-phosphate reductase [Robiginitomaculum sp.]|nr:MAG: N-acetyl-gamma-glutamyl-phosphate reductase [Robiginitomaculum sp.]
MADKKRIGIIGARGFVGGELLKLIKAHPKLELAYASSRQQAGTKIDGFDGAMFESLSPDEAAKRAANLVFLALPNGVAAPWVEVILKATPRTRFIDMSADYRFDDDWAYGLSELNREALRGAALIANPGCYATAAQLAIAPMVSRLCTPPAVFGVSGYSGAGTTPSPKNDPKMLKDNFMPYGLSGHMHEREIGHQLGTSVHFMPHVAAFFRGLSVTVNLGFKAPITVDELRALYAQGYAGETFVTVSDEAPQVRDIVNTFGARVGGFSLAEGGRRAVMICVLDNLLKGAASQAIQNLNLSFGFTENEGLQGAVA